MFGIKWLTDDCAPDMHRTFGSGTFDSVRCSRLPRQEAAKAAKRILQEGLCRCCNLQDSPNKTNFICLHQAAGLYPRPSITTKRKNNSMKDVIDVMQLQREKGRFLPAWDYTQKETNFISIRFIFECGMKLDAQPLTISTAAILYHRFFKETDSSSYDCYLISSTCLYLAGKIKDDPLKIRDVINVAHNTLHRGMPPLELGDEYWNMRDGIVQAELLVMRILKFEVNIVHPHKYILHYLKSLECWFDQEEWRKMPLARGSFAFLQDFHYDPSILDYSPQHIAVACINLALQCYGGEVPFTDEGDGISWYSVFTDDLKKESLWEIMEKLMEVYNKEPEDV